MGTLQPGVPYTDDDPDDVTEQVSGDRSETEVDASTFVVGPASAIDDNVATFDLTTGKLIQDGGATVAQLRDRTTHTGGGRCALRHTKALAVPNNVWTPLPWNTVDSSANGMGVIDTTTSTTIAAGSNGATLPTATINVASTAGFDTGGGYLTIDGPPGANVLTLVKYLGVTATTFTGCTLGTGTLATSQVVRPANAKISLPVAGLYSMMVQNAWAVHATGRRGIKFKLAGFVDYGILEVPTTNTASQSTATAWIFDTSTQVDVYVEVLQTSGGVLNNVADALTLPSVSAAFMRAR